jgi:outer membrane receptor protein involved in Fe transport
MTLSKLLYTTILLVTAASFSLKAQDTKPPEKTGDDKKITEEIEVVRPYKPILAEAVKLRRSPDLSNVATYKAKFNYSITDKKLGLNSDINKLQAQQLAEERRAELVNNYVKGALGSLNTSLLEAYINIGRDEALQAGAFFKHFGQKGDLPGQLANQQELSVFGRSIGEKVTLSGRLNYQRNGLAFYGYDALRPDLNPDPQKQAFNFIEAEGEVINKYTEDENAVSYAAKVNGYVWSDKFDAKESSVVLNGYVNKRISSFNLGLAAAAEFGNTKDSATNIGNNILRLNPYIRLQANGIKITAGVNFVQEFGTYSTGHLFPAITADFTIIPDYLQIFGEVKGDVNRNSLKQLTDENPYLNSNIEIQNTVEKLSISGGIKGTGGPGFGYKAKVYRKTISQMPLFVNNFNSFNKFDVIYDFGDMKLLGLEGELSVQVSDALKWTGKLNIEDYKPASESESWFKPSLRVSSNLLYNINQKISFNAAVAIQGESQAKIYTAAPSQPYILPNPETESIVSVKGYVDLGVGAGYKINKQFSVFARANNLLNKNYSRYLYYEAIGVNLFGGVTYSF